MTRTRYTLDDIGGRLSWPALFSFISYLPAGNALVEDRELRQWADGTIIPWLLAAILDAIQAWATRGKAKPIPRPDQKKKTTRRIGGADPIPASDFDRWWNGEE